MGPADDRGWQPRPAPAWTGLLVGPAFLGVAAWFLWGPEMVDLPSAPTVSIDPALISTRPPRKTLTAPPPIEVEGVERTCTDCHSHLLPARDEPVERAFHREIKLRHGMNDRCRNCHDVGSRNRLVLHGGQLVSYAESPLLCAKCHGPTYRDWQRGAHGRTNGYWDASRGEVRRLQCAECHNPHDPQADAMDPIRPLPGPRSPWGDDQGDDDHAGDGGASDGSRERPREGERRPR